MYDTTSELYNYFLGNYYHKCDKLSDHKRNEIESKYCPKDLFLDGYDYIVWSENEEESTDKEESENLLPVPPLEGDEEEAKKEKYLTQNKLLTRLPMLLAQMKAANNSKN